MIPSFLALYVSYLFLKLSFVNGSFLGALVEGVLEEGDVLLVFLTLNDHFLDGALLLPQDLDSFGVPPLFLVQFQLKITHASFQFADDALSTDDSIGFDFFEADG